MSTEAPEEAMAAANTASISNDHCHRGCAKGMTNKRQRPLQTPAPAAASSTSSSPGEFSGGTTEEEEKMANCLILLAQGRAVDACPKPEAQVKVEGGGGGGGGERFISRRLAEAPSTTDGKVGFYVYECKTCNKCFPSFQALGGHRTSHKKAKTVPSTTVTAVGKRARHVDDILQIRFASYSTAVSTTPTTTTTTPISAQNNKPRVHECSICGSEFSSGQALGGHMRRHRPAAATPETTQEVKREKSLLSLDLNLPLPMEEEMGDVNRPPSFHFTDELPLVFSSSALVAAIIN